MDRPSWVPPEIDIETPNAARMYDYSLGGSHNFAADRALVDKITKAMPEAIPNAYANRGFLRRAVRTLADLGVRQFLDIGSGIPTVGNVHEIVQRVATDARVVYVDADPVAVAHGDAMLRDQPTVEMIQGDLREPDRILADTRVRGLLDFEAPIGVILCAVLHFVPDTDGPGRIVETLMDAVAPGSYLALSHGSRDDQPNASAITEVYERTSSPLSLRTREEITGFFTGLDLLDPGVTVAGYWRPEQDEEPEDLPLLVGVGRRGE